MPRSVFSLSNSDKRISKFAILILNTGILFTLKKKTAGIHFHNRPFIPSSVEMCFKFNKKSELRNEHWLAVQPACIDAAILGAVETMDFLRKTLSVGRRRDSKTFHQKSTFRVKYLGYCLNFRDGFEGIQRAVEEIKTKGGQRDYRNTIKTNCIKITSKGVSFVERKSERDTELIFIPLKKISYGLIYERQSNIFAFNHHVSQKHVECHAVVCESERKAVEIDRALYSVFRGEHFENLRRGREENKDERDAGIETCTTK